jgi:hypothetical protein
MWKHGESSMIKHIYFLNRKEYYRRKHISEGLKRYWREKKSRERIIEEQFKEEIIYFINFNFAENRNGNEQSGIFGSLSSPNKISLHDAKIIIKNALPFGYTPFNFYEAQEKGSQSETKLIIYRDGDEIHEENLNV